jgi:hypothetical protein
MSRKDRKVGTQVSDGSSAGPDRKLERAAVSNRHPMFGALKGLVRIAPGTDLTDPADPDWGGAREHDPR